MRRTGAVGLVLACLFALAAAGEAYKYFDWDPAAPQSRLRWSRFPVRYLIDERGGAGLTKEQLRSVIDSSFAAWQEIPSARVSFEFGGYTAALPTRGDSDTVFAVEDLGPGVLGITRFLYNIRTGEMTSADIALTSRAAWTTAPSGEPGRQDMRSTTTHEIGHLLGLAHSMIGETEPVGGGLRVLGARTIMFPIAFSLGVVGRAISADDVAGVSELYPAPGFRDQTGRLEGQVTRGGRGVRRAHVVAFDAESGDMVGQFTGLDGRFTIAGLRPGPKIVRVEPLDDARIISFYRDEREVDADFPVTTLDRIVFVAAGRGETVTIALEGR